jgi:hypothetical protein
MEIVHRGLPVYELQKIYIGSSILVCVSNAFNLKNWNPSD